MDNFGALLSSNDRQIYLERSGMVTRCRLACEALDKGRSVALVARTREEFNAARSLATLFSPEISLADPSHVRPVWQQPCLGLPALSQWQDKPSWATRLAALYALSLGKPRVLVVSVESLLLRYMPVNFFHSRTLEIGKGSDYAPELLLSRPWNGATSGLPWSHGPARWHGVVISLISFPLATHGPCGWNFLVIPWKKCGFSMPKPSVRFRGVTN